MQRAWLMFQRGNAADHGESGFGSDRRLGRLRFAGPAEDANKSHHQPVGRAVGAAVDRRDRRPADRVPVAPRQGPSVLTLRHQLPRQYRRAQTCRRHRSGLAVGVRLVQGKSGARHLRPGRSVRRPHPQARELVLRQRLRGACLDGASGVAAAAHPYRRSGAGRGYRHRARRHLCVHRGPAILDAGRKPHLQELSAMR